MIDWSVPPCEVTVQWWAEHPENGEPALFIDGRQVDDETKVVLVWDQQGSRVLIDDVVQTRTVRAYRNGHLAHIIPGRAS